MCNGAIATQDERDGTSAGISSINNMGVTVGGRTDGTGRAIGLVAGGGEQRVVTYPKAASTLLTGINDLGEIAGQANFAGSRGDVAFALQGSVFSTIAPPGATSSDAGPVNNAWQVVGTFTGPFAGIESFVATPQ